MIYDETWNDFRKIKYLRKVITKQAKNPEEESILYKLAKVEKQLVYKYDFYRFCIEVLQAEKKGEEPVAFAPIHRKLCRHIRTCKNLGLNCLVRLPRYHLKTQIATIYYRIWRLVNSPELCAIIVSGTLELSKDSARTIKQELMSNELLKALYPEVLPEWLRNERRNKWTETEFNIARKGNYAQCTIEAVGVDATVTGKHFGEIQFDDVVTRENSTTPEQCQKVIKAYQYFLSIGNPKKSRGKIPIMVVGTNYTDHDLYAFLEQPEIKKMFRVLVQPVFDNNGEPIWSLHTKESLENIRFQQGTYIFSCQYLLDPVPEDQQEFKRSWIQLYRELPRDINEQEISLEKMIFVDPITMKKTNSSSHDRGVILTVGWDKRKNIYVLDYILYERAKESEMFEGIFSQMDKWGVTNVGWETVAYQLQGKYNLEEKATELRRRIKVIQLEPGHRDKDVRIRTLIPHFERGQFFIRYWMNDLIQELLRFPHGRTRDILDMLAYALIYITPKKQFGNSKMWRTDQGASQPQWYL